jgi:hypothetical protein
MAQTLTATIGPAYATNKNVTWTAEWKDSNSAWAKGKSVTDYVTVVPTETGSNVATVSNLQAFGEQIIVKVTSESDPEVYATATVDYAKRIMEGYINFGVFGIVVFAILAGAITSWADRNYWASEHLLSKERVVYPFLMLQYFFLLRGDMMSGGAYLIARMVMGLAIYYSTVKKVPIRETDKLPEKPTLSKYIKQK